MSKSTFGRKQELKSLEFGTLLYNIIQKGVYKSPTIVISSNTREISVTGGVFLFYNSDNTIPYAVRVQDVNLTKSDVQDGEFLFITYTYSNVSAAEPNLISSADPTSDYSKIRLGRLIRVPGADGDQFAFDISSMELAGNGYTSQSSFVDFINYNYSESGDKRLIARFNGKVITNTGVITISSVDSTSFEGLDSTKAQYLYVDSEGVLKCADNTVPRFGKLVIAEKTANENFVINRYPYRAELGAWNLEVKKPSVEKDSEEDVIYTQAISKTKLELNTSEDVISISNMLKTLTEHVAEIENSIYKTGGYKERLEYLEEVKRYLGESIYIPTKENIESEHSTTLKVKGVDTEAGYVTKINGSIITNPETSSFGTPDSPIHNLYVSQTLYTDHLFVTE